MIISKEEAKIMYRWHEMVVYEFGGDECSLESDLVENLEIYIKNKNKEDIEILNRLQEILKERKIYFESVALNSFDYKCAIENLAKTSICKQVLHLIDLLKINKETELI